MATDGGQQHKPKSKVTRETEETEMTVGEKINKEALDSEIDSILEEIDGVLEENAEEFVRGFIQKGGQ